MSQIVAPVRAGGRRLHWLGPLALLVVAAAVVMVITSAPVGGGAGHPQAERRAHSAHHHGHQSPAYWTVRPGDTLAQISAKTGVSVSRIEVYNPNVSPQALAIGERLRLRAHPPPPRPARPKPPGPLFWTVRSGESYGSIAAATGINLARLEQLNPKLAPTKIQPGDQIQLQPTATVEHAAATVAAARAAMVGRLRLGHSGAQP